MALPLGITLSEARQAVLTRVGMALDGNLPANQNALVDEKLRSAQSQLYQLMHWTHMNKRRDSALAEGVTVYDFPDDCDPGQIQRIICVRESDGFEAVLQPGLRPSERNAFSNDVSANLGVPARYEFEDETITIMPAPDAEWTVLRFEYYARPTKFIEDADRASVDAEALLMLGEILLKEHYTIPGTETLRQDLSGYLNRLKGKQSVGDGFQPGGNHAFHRRQQAKQHRFRGGDTKGGWAYWRPW
jgi:hypothetical protein